MSNPDILSFLHDSPKTEYQIYAQFYPKFYHRDVRRYEAWGGMLAQLRALYSRHKIRPCKLIVNGHKLNAWYRVK